MVQAYSYIRFSSKKQELGDSVRRQTELRDSYLARHPELTLNEKNYEDFGVSAFRGANAATGHLSAFLAAVRKGDIPKGSYLLVESIDRISRGKVREARKIFTEIIELGITLVTFQPEQVFNLEIIDNDWTKLLGLDVLMARAHEESATKADRVKRKWQAKRDQGKLLTTRGPAWLEIAEDKQTWIVLEGKAKIIRNTFDLALKGYGVPTIARMLNAQGLKTLRLDRPWSIRTVHKLLTDPIVIGTMQAEDGQNAPIPDYYPAIINATDFYKVREAMQRRRYIGGGPASEYQVNILAGITYCHRCGSRMRVMGAKGKYRYLSCLSAYGNTGCEQGRFAYRPVELTVLGYLSEKLLPLLAKSRSEIVDAAAILKIERDELRRRIGNMIDALADVPSPALKTKINETQAKLDKLNVEIDQVVPPDVTHQAVGAAADLIRKLNTSVHSSTFTREERLMLRDAVKQMIHSVYCWTDADGLKWCSIYHTGYVLIDDDGLENGHRTLLGRKRAEQRSAKTGPRTRSMR